MERRLTRSRLPLPPPLLEGLLASVVVLELLFPLEPGALPEEPSEIPLELTAAGCELVPVGPADCVLTADGVSGAAAFVVVTSPSPVLSVGLASLVLTLASLVLMLPPGEFCWLSEAALAHSMAGLQFKHRLFQNSSPKISFNFNNYHKLQISPRPIFKHNARHQ